MAGATGTDPNGSAADGTTARHVQISVTADAPLLFWSLLSLGAVAQDADRRAGARRRQRAAVHGLRHRALRGRRQGRERPREFRLRRSGRRRALHLLLQLHRAPPPTFLPDSGQSAAVHDHQSLRRRQHHRRATRPTSCSAMAPGGLLSSTTPNPTGSSRAPRLRGHRRCRWKRSGADRCSPPCRRLARRRCRRWRRPRCAACLRASITPPCPPPAPPRSPTIRRSPPPRRSIATRARRRISTPPTPATAAASSRWPIVDALAPNSATPMTVLGFRQFLVQPNPDGTPFNPSDANGRFVATYIGSPMPLKQGNIDDRYAVRRLSRRLRARERWSCTNEARTRRQRGDRAGDVAAHPASC